MSTQNMVYRLLIICNLIPNHHKNGMRVMMDSIMIRQRTLLIVQGKEERSSLVDIKIQMIKIMILETQMVLQMKLLSLLLRMMIVLHFRQAIGHFNQEHILVKRSSSVMFQVMSTWQTPMINIDQDFLQLRKINQLEKVYIKLRELQIKTTIVLKEINKTIDYKEV